MERWLKEAVGGDIIQNFEIKWIQLIFNSKYILENLDIEWTLLDVYICCKKKNKKINLLRLEFDAFG